MAHVQHMVMLRFRSGVNGEQIEALYEMIRGMRARIPGILYVEGGPYASPEGLHHDFTHGFLVTFESVAARDGYLPHPEHIKVRDALLEVLEDVAAFDFVGR